MSNDLTPNKMIEHGIPKHNFFAIAQPPSVSKPTTDCIQPDFKYPVLNFQDPKSGVKFKAELIEHWRFYNIDELLGDNAFCLLVYGIPAAKLIKVLCRRYPEIDQTRRVNFLLLKKL